MRPVKTFGRLLFTIVFSTIILSCSVKNNKNTRIIYDLSGVWQFSTDEGKTGIGEKWYMNALSDSITLPGSMDENRKGWLNKDTTHMHLNRVYKYYGAAWFKKEIDVPEEWTGKHIELIMERTKVTQVWLDTVYLGSNNTLFSKQVYDLTGMLAPGKHQLTIMVDNDINLVPVAGSHAYEENTQTNWNGILGSFCIEVSNPVRIHTIRTYPDIHSKSVKVHLRTLNTGENLTDASVTLKAELWNCDEKHLVKTKSFNVEVPRGENRIELEYALGEKAVLWSEFEPALYKLHIELKSGSKILDNRTVDFGLREFTASGTQFSINGLTTFLRGKQDGCIFPLTGYPPMDTAGWNRVFRIAKSYGINHYRYHSWCPPKAAFISADVCGIYLQPELPIWWSFRTSDSSHLAFMMKEGYNMLDNYGNHASFVMMALGNEIHQNREVLQQMVSDFRKYDSRHLYAVGSNNWLGNPSLVEGDDYWTSMRTGREQPDCSTDIRASASFLDSKEGGILNTYYPSSDKTFSKAIGNVPIPAIGHETGQYQVYPDYSEIEKYTGILKPWSLEIFRKRLTEKGMIDQADDLFRASGKLAAICYRDEIEMAIRTPGFAGFQLLDLQDYSGQGTALVGMLDAFMDSKGVITPEEFRQFCNDAVILLEMKKFCWTNDEPFKAVVKIANYGSANLPDENLEWSIVNDQTGETYFSGNIETSGIKQGGITLLGEITADFKNLQQAVKASVDMHLEESGYKNSYPVWIYPAETKTEIPEEIIVVKALTTDVMSKLNNGSNVLFLPDHKLIEKNSIEGMYITEFWNWEMFKGFAEKNNKKVSPGSMGLIMDPEHPVLSEFPTAFHSDRQWWAIAKHSRPIILDNTPAGYKPLVQVIDNITRNHKLGLLFEFNTGKGKLMVCAVDFDAIADKPEAGQFYYSIIKYMKSGDFKPETELSTDDLKKILY